MTDAPGHAGHLAILMVVGASSQCCAGPHTLCIVVKCSMCSSIALHCTHSPRSLHIRQVTMKREHDSSEVSGGSEKCERSSERAGLTTATPKKIKTEWKVKPEPKVKTEPSPKGKTVKSEAGAKSTWTADMKADLLDALLDQSKQVDLREIAARVSGSVY